MAQIKEDIRNRDAIDFANEPIETLFRKMFIPTLLGMVSMVVLNLSDGAFVGHGVGSAALAAVNVAAPIFNIMTGIGIAFGVGSSIIASIHLSQGNLKAARINMTQGLLGSVLIAALVAILILLDLEGTCRLFGSNDALIPLGSSYLEWIAMSLPLQMLGITGAFSVRLDGSPKFAMACTLVASALNIFLDWLFIFPLHMGLEGAAKATALSFSISGMMSLGYMIFGAKDIKLYRLRLTPKSLVLTLRNQWYQIKAGFSAFLGEVAISGSIIVGNYVFVAYLGENGVAAYSAACYCLPIVFMLANSIVQSAQPIVSFAHGAGNKTRVESSKRLMLGVAFFSGLCVSAFLLFGRTLVVSLFIPKGDPSYDIAISGMPFFAISGVLVALNLSIIGYYQSIEKAGRSTLLMLLRGFIIVIPMFILLPKALGIAGIWLSIPLSELLTLLLIAVMDVFGKGKL